MNQFELVFDNNSREFEQVWSYVQKLLINPTSQERINQVDEMEKVFKRSFQEIRTPVDSISRSLNTKASSTAYQEGQDNLKLCKNRHSNSNTF